MATASESIVHIAETKRYLQLGTTTEYDRFLVELISMATDKMETFCQRTFIETTHRKWLDGTGTGTIFVPDSPVTSLTRLGWDRKKAMSVDSATTTDIRASVEVQDTGVVLKRWDSVGASTTTTLAFADYLTSTLMAAAIDGTTGWDATSDATTLCDDFMRQGGQDAKGSTAQINYIDDTSAQFSMDESTGRVTLLASSDAAEWFPYDSNAMSFPSGSGNIYVEYTAGYTLATMPAAIKQVCIELVAASYHAGRHDPTVASESLDAYSYSTRNAMELRDDHKAKMWQYRRSPQ
jgi:hypothetical protein